MNDQIRDLPHMKKLAGMRQLVQVFLAGAAVARPFLRLAGRDLSSLDEKVADWRKWEQQAVDLETIPDRFNRIFGDRGWIMYESSNLEVARACVLKAEGGDVDGAEHDLVEQFTPDYIRWKLMFMRGVQAFRPRQELAEKALSDYAEGRYYASVLVTLSLLDGLVRKKPSAEMKKAVPCSSRLYWRAPFTSCQGMRAPAACIAGTPWLAHGATFPMPLGVPRLAHFHPRAGPSVTAPSPRGTRRGRSRRRPPRSSRAGSPSSSAGALRPSTLPALLLHDAGGALPRDDGVRSLRRVHRSRAPPRMTGASGGSVRLSGDALVVTLDVFDHAREILLRARMRDRWHRIPSLGHYSARIRRAAGNGDPQPERKGKRLRLRQT
jgi:hypothetical protein